MDATGNFVRGQSVEWVVTAHVSDLGAERQRVVFGGVINNRYAVRILQSPPFEPNEIKIGEMVYKIDKRTILKNKNVYIVSEA